MSFLYQKGSLHCASFDLEAFARQQEDAFYFYNLDHVEKRVQLMQKALQPKGHVHYAMKANSSLPLLQRMQKWGVGVDVVSGGEIALALQTGFHPQQIVFSGVGKTQKEITQALSLGVYQINVESPQELERIARTAASLKIKAAVALRINPDVNPQTHPYITTGFRENKFGMDVSFLPLLKNLLRQFANHVELVGLTLHIGSQLHTLDVLCEAIEKTRAVYLDLQKEGWPLTRCDVGGGLGVCYESADETAEENLIQEYGQKVQSLLAPLTCEIQSEPGRILVARSGLLLGQVQYIKETAHKNFIIMNTGMHHLIRPALYQAEHRILPVQQKSAPVKNYDLVGPICESADVIAKNVSLPCVEPGDWLAIADAGAYGMTMSSGYNQQTPPAEFFFHHNQLV